MNKNKVNKLPYLLCAIGLMLNFFPILIVHGDSMSPTCQNNDRILATGLFYKINRGDVVIVRKNGSYIKRIVGLPGETIEIKNGLVYIDGKPFLEDEFAPVDNDTSNYIARSNTKSITLADNEYYVLGDNRAMSCDSRQWISQGIRIYRNDITQKVLAYLGQTLSKLRLS